MEAVARKGAERTAAPGGQAGREGKEAEGRKRRKGRKQERLKRALERTAAPQAGPPPTVALPRSQPCISSAASRNASKAAGVESTGQSIAPPTSGSAFASLNQTTPRTRV